MLERQVMHPGLTKGNKLDLEVDFSTSRGESGKLFVFELVAEIIGLSCTNQ